MAALRTSRWARQHSALERVDDATFHLYASAGTVTCEHAYIEHLIERYCPERAAWWWGSEIEERRADPRVCSFCDGYERERCRILGLPQPPTGIADLQLFLWEAKERERESARTWMKSLETSYTTEEYAELQRSLARWEYLHCQLYTDLAQMLLDTAIYLGRRRHDRRGRVNGGRGSP